MVLLADFAPKPKKVLQPARRMLAALYLLDRTAFSSREDTLISSRHSLKRGGSEVLGRVFGSSNRWSRLCCASLNVPTAIIVFLPSLVDELCSCRCSFSFYCHKASITGIFLSDLLSKSFSQSEARRSITAGLELSLLERERNYPYCMQSTSRAKAALPGLPPCGCIFSVCRIPGFGTCSEG